MKFNINMNYIGMDEKGEITNLVLLHKLIEETKNNLENKAYLTSLTTALTLPDICFSLLNTDMIKLELPYLVHSQSFSENPSKWNSSFKYAYFLNKYADIKQINYKENSLPTDNIMIGFFSYYLRCSLLHEGRIELENSMNLSALSFFMTDLQHLFETKNTNINSKFNKKNTSENIKKNKTELRFEYIKEHRISNDKMAQNNMRLKIKMNIGPNYAPGVIKNDKNGCFFSINSSDLINLILEASNKFIYSNDINNKIYNQDIYSPGKVFLNNSTSKLNRDFLS
ncbi:hypothetical protein [Companilactobacillus muriivasis]|uniref:hypothetical protein n=1 Tax=Companilactobacillus muriivasis TaxID=3081444 RepID=UPI0030C7009E